MTKERKSYPSDVSEEEWAFCAPYLTLMKEDAPQREHPLRELCNGLLWFVRAGCPWRMLPHDLPPWSAVQQQPRVGCAPGVFEAMALDLRLVLRLVGGLRRGQEAERIEGHAAVDTLGHLLALKVTAANEQDRAQVADLTLALQSATCENVALAFVDQGYTGEKPAAAAQEHGLRLEVVKYHEAKRGFILLPRRWVVERTFAWAARFRRLARDDERLARTLAGYHWLALALLMLQSVFAKSA